MTFELSLQADGKTFHLYKDGFRIYPNTADGVDSNHVLPVTQNGVYAGVIRYGNWRYTLSPEPDVYESNMDTTLEVPAGLYQFASGGYNTAFSIIFRTPPWFTMLSPTSDQTYDPGDLIEIRAVLAGNTPSGAVLPIRWDGPAPGTMKTNSNIIYEASTNIFKYFPLTGGESEIRITYRIPTTSSSLGAIYRLRLVASGNRNDAGSASDSFYELSVNNSYSSSTLGGNAVLISPGVWSATVKIYDTQPAGQPFYRLIVNSSTGYTVSCPTLAVTGNDLYINPPVDGEHVVTVETDYDETLTLNLKVVVCPYESYLVVPPPLSGNYGYTLTVTHSDCLGTSTYYQGQRYYKTPRLFFRAVQGAVIKTVLKMIKENYIPPSDETMLATSIVNNDRTAYRDYIYHSPAGNVYGGNALQRVEDFSKVSHDFFVKAYHRYLNVIGGTLSFSDDLFGNFVFEIIRD